MCSCCDHDSKLFPQHVRLFSHAPIHAFLFYMHPIPPLFLCVFIPFTLPHVFLLLNKPIWYCLFECSLFTPPPLQIKNTKKHETNENATYFRDCVDLLRMCCFAQRNAVGRGHWHLGQLGGSSGGGPRVGAWLGP